MRALTTRFMQYKCSCNIPGIPQQAMVLSILITVVNKEKALTIPALTPSRLTVHRVIPLVRYNHSLTSDGYENFLHLPSVTRTIQPETPQILGQFNPTIRFAPSTMPVIASRKTSILQPQPFSTLVNLG